MILRIEMPFSRNHSRDRSTPTPANGAVAQAMRKICSWCEAEMPATHSKETQGHGGVSHGICKQCSDNLSFQVGVDLQKYVKRLGVPVLLVDEDVTVLGGNAQAFDCLGLGADAVTGNYGGDIFECQHARRAGGCGGSVHCSGCTIRRTVEATLRTGRSHIRVPATIRFEVGGVAADRWIVISTVKAGDAVLLKIDSTVGL